MLNFILGGAGTGKSENMLSRIYAAVNAGKSCIVIVPDQFSFEYDKKLYAKLGITGYNRLTVFSFQRIAKNIFINYGGKKGSYAENSAKLALTYLAVRHVRDNDGLAFYERQSASGGFIGAVSDAMKELHWAGVSSEELADKSAWVGGELSDKTTDI